MSGESYISQIWLLRKPSPEFLCKKYTNQMYLPSEYPVLDTRPVSSVVNRVQLYALMYSLIHLVTGYGPRWT